MILEEFLKGAVPSDRLIIEDSTGEHYNLTHSGPGISCGSASDCRELCPHYQNKYEVCFEDGLCGEWLTQLADRLEELLPDRRGGGE